MRSSRAVTIAALAALGAAVSPAAAQRQAGRVRPPEAVTCPRNLLTLYAGRVVALSRQTGSTSLTIATDWNTIEHVTIKHPDAPDAAASFLMGGKAFAKEDWALIQPGGTLKAGARASAWVCSDGRAPVIDWERPGGATDGYLP